MYFDTNMLCIWSNPFLNLVHLLTRIAKSTFIKFKSEFLSLFKQDS